MHRHALSGLVVTPAGHLRLCDSWEAHDAEVERLLGCFNDTRERFRHSFPKEELEPPSDADWCHYMLTGENACCGLHVFGNEAYVSRLCAWPQRHGHGAEFMRAVERYLRASTTAERVWLFTDADAPPRLLGFYETQLGFREVFDCCAPPAWICEMWGSDHLFVKNVRPTWAGLVKDVECNVDPVDPVDKLDLLSIKDPQPNLLSIKDPQLNLVSVQDPQLNLVSVQDPLSIKDPERTARCDPEPSPVATPANHCARDPPRRSRARERLPRGSGARRGQSAAPA